MGVVGEPAIFGNLTYGLIRVYKQLLCKLHSACKYILGTGDAIALLVQPLKMRHGQA